VPAQRHNRPFPAFTLFFPAAALLAAAAVGVQVADYAGVSAPSVIARMPYWHGHEMVFGYALAVVGGYLFTRLSRAKALGLVLVWFCGRLVFLVPDIPQVVIAADAMAFPLSLFLFGGLPFVKAAKSWDNAIFGPIVAGFLVAELVFQLGALDILEGGEARGLVVGIDLVALILFAMGGRIIAAATSGALQRKGSPLIGPAQPRWERAGVSCLFGMAVADLFMAVEPIAGALAAALAIVTMVRLVKWRFWSVLGTPEVSVLHLGYAWLGLGFAFKASAQIGGELGLFDALHGVAVGALGTLSLAMMTRTTLQRSRMTIRVPKVTLMCITMVSIAAILRLLAALPEVRLIAIQFAAVFWMLAFLLFALWLFTARRGIAFRSRTRSVPN
jgi:uncharacterized protein involved in response to NO